MSKEENTKKEVENGFLFLGLGSLLSWNTILSQLDFFILYQKDYNPEIVFPNINFLINLIIQFLLLSTKKIFSYKSMFYFSLLIYAFILFFFPYITIYFPSEISFKISCIFILLNGLANAVISNSMFGLVSFFPIENVIAVGAGQGISGILMTLIRYVILLTLDPQKSINLSSYIFFGISSIIILIVIRNIMHLYKNEYFLSVLKNIGEIKSDDINDNLIENKTEEELKEINANENVEKNNDESENKHGMLYLIIKIFDINLLVILSFVITIGLFPSVCIRPNLFGMSIGWKINTIIFLFNLFDTFGRKLLACVKKPSKLLLYIVSILRLAFFFTFPGLIYLEKYNIINNPNIIGILSVINVSLMALTSGFVLNLSLSLAPEQVENNLKAKAGSCISLCLSIGLFCGSFTANVLDKIIKKL